MNAGRGMLLAAAAAGLLTNSARPTGDMVLAIEPVPPEPPAPTPASVIVCQRGPRAGIWCQDQASFDAIMRHPSVQRATRDHLDGAMSYYGLLVRVATAEEWAALEAEAAEGKLAPDPMAGMRAWTAFWEDLGWKQRRAAQQAAEMERARPEMERAEAKRARKAAKRLNALARTTGGDHA